MALFGFGKKKEETAPCCGGDAVQIAQYGVMQTPALVINSKVVSYGKLIKVEEAKKLIEKAGVQE